MEVDKKSVCIIGAGPSGLSQLVAFAGKEDTVEVVCLEKGKEVGGQWQYDWHRGLTEYGEHVHSSMYRELVINAPKEMLEYPDYSYEDCFVKTKDKWWPKVGDGWKPSYVPRELMYIYMKQRVVNCDMYKNIEFTTVVQNVRKKDGRFEVTSLDLKSQKVTTRTFDYVVVGVGHYTTPNIPFFPGLDRLRRISVMHSHDFKVPTGYEGKNVFVLGGSYSAEDLTSMVWKFGANKVYMSSRSPFNPYEGWPENITFHAGLKECRVEYDGHTTKEVVVLSDGTELTDVDAILLCTGYRYNFRFIDDEIRLNTRHLCVADELYKGVWKTSDPNIMYLGMQDQILSFTMFDVQAHVCARYVLGHIVLPDKATMDADVKKWMDALEPINDFQNKFMEVTQLQIDAQQDIIDMEGNDYNQRTGADGKPMRVYCNKSIYDGFYGWKKAKKTSIMTFRDHTCKSCFVGDDSVAPLNTDKWKDWVIGSQPYAGVSEQW